MDYYSQGGVCFADRRNQITINFDGNIYKCTTIKRFDNDNALGQLDCNNGNVIWDESKIAYLSNEGIPSGCHTCQMFPSCGGPCRKKTPGWKDEDCFLKSQRMSMEEYALIQFKAEMTKGESSEQVPQRHDYEIIMPLHPFPSVTDHID